MQRLVLFFYLLILSATLLASQQNAGKVKEEKLECIIALGNDQSVLQLIIAFFGLVLALKVGDTGPARKIKNRFKKMLRARHAI